MNRSMTIALSCTFDAECMHCCFSAQLKAMKVTVCINLKVNSVTTTFVSLCCGLFVELFFGSYI